MVICENRPHYTSENQNSACQTKMYTTQSLRLECLNLLRDSIGLGRVYDLSFFDLSLFCFSFIEFRCTFFISYKILQYFVYYYYILISM